MDPLDRLFHALVHAAQQAGVSRRPITIRELVEELLPYRVVRPMRIAELLDDYRQLVMRLIAGERDLVAADPEVRAAASAALGSRHPDLSLLDRYGDRLVTLASEASLAPPPAPSPSADVAPPTPPSRAGDAASSATSERGAPEPCRYCTRALPAGYTARFCPWCGQHLLRRCQTCRASLEATWTFCVSCGHPA